MSKALVTSLESWLVLEHRFTKLSNTADSASLRVDLSMEPWPIYIAVTSVIYGVGQGRILLDDVNCRGTETSLDQCAHRGFYVHNCAHSEDIGIVCNISGKLEARLVGGSQSAGRLEILYNGTWNTVCDNGFRNVDAQVACRMLGFGSSGAVAVASDTFGPGQGRILLDDVNCLGTETAWNNATMAAFFTTTVHIMKTSESAVRPRSCTYPEARLVSGRSLEGRFGNLCTSGEWSTVCGDQFGTEEAQVTCRMLGYRSSKAVSASSSVYGAGQGSIILDDLNCRGTEDNLIQCSHAGLYRHNCQHSKDIGVMCINNASWVRLTGTWRTSLLMGRPDILINGEWSMLCDISVTTAAVICRHLGYPSTVAKVVDASTFGPLQGRFLNAVLNCVGNETNIFSCLTYVYGYINNCPTRQGVGVICSNTNHFLYIVIAANSAANSYPLIEGTSIILKCEGTERDQMITNFTWPETAGGRPFGEYLTFDNVTREHNGRQVQCEGSYLSSGVRHSTVSEILVLQAYYHPFISVTFHDNECEPVNGFPNHCAITEGHNFTLRCEADSNPPPASITWSGKVSSSTKHMSIVSANRSQHGGEYMYCCHTVWY
ncbi:deleted in malignant brain tumors 1 protein-like [Pomacea canaliculata]|uniref:deleted in malignant brain tumors 1 protein-like n=1 Tax=Pomacea canaliculata TaxID=400727 RepID=UPI000D73706E|nr:deleted in malignant brain tumors 1 protein-like [Pomacea canaliculata]